MDDEYKDYIKNLAKDFVKSEKLDAILVKALNGYADKIKNRLRTKLQTKKLTEISRKIASTKIAKSYRAKLSQFELNIAVATQICSLSGAKDVYFKNIAKLLEDNGSALKIRDMYFYYCKFGNKFIGYDPVKKEGFVNEFINTVFLNVSFKSTKFLDVKFRLTKFINAKYNDQHFKSLMARSPKLRTLKKDFKQQDEFFLDHSKFKNATFEDCYFYRIKLNNTIVFDITKNNKYPAPFFINSKFNNCDFILPLSSNTVVNYAPSTEIKDKYYLPDLAVTKNLTDHKYLDYYYTKQKNVIKPDFIFEKTRFYDIKFSKGPGPAAKDIHLKRYLFLECVLNFCIFDIENIHNCLFENTTFKGVIFRDIKFVKNIFTNCRFIGCQFISCHLGNQSFNEFDNCILSDSTFSGCILCNYFDPTNVLIIRNNCEFNKCKFSDTLMKLMKVNFDYSCVNLHI